MKVWESRRAVVEGVDALGKVLWGRGRCRTLAEDVGVSESVEGLDKPFDVSERR